MKLSGDEKKAIKKYTLGTELIGDPEEALSLLAVHGEDCLDAINPKIRAQAREQAYISRTVKKKK